MLAVILFCLFAPCCTFPSVCLLLYFSVNVLAVKPFCLLVLAVLLFCAYCLTFSPMGLMLYFPTNAFARPVQGPLLGKLSRAANFFT